MRRIFPEEILENYNGWKGARSAVKGTQTSGTRPADRAVVTVLRIAQRDEKVAVKMGLCARGVCEAIENQNSWSGSITWGAAQMQVGLNETHR